MKPLNDVIDVLDGCFLKSRKEWCIENCPYLQNDEQTCRRDVLNDALHYLKELRDMTDIPMEYFENGGTWQKLRNTSQITCPKCHSEFLILDDPDGDHQQLLKCQALLQDFYRNDPLDWSELKQMFHKPVWIETKAKSTWCIINNFDDECVNVIHTSHKGAKCSHFAKHLMGDTWQAYRKERS